MDHEKQATETREPDVVAAIHLMGEDGANPAADDALRWKIDLRVIPLLCITYALQSIDKTTLSYAAVFGIRESINLVGTQFSWASSVFYLGYLVWEYPTNLLLQRLPVNTFLSVTVIVWGGILMCHAAVQNFAGLMACRTLLGVFEASMNPASMIIFAMYYTRQEQPFRMGLWIGSAGIGYIIAGIATFGIGHINSGIESWRVLFLFWGAFTMAWGVVLLVWLPGSPATSKCWTEEQRIGILDRIKDNGTGIEDKRFKFDQFKEAMLDPKTWLLFLFATASNSPNGGLTAFQGLIIKGLGFSNLRTTLIQMPSGGVQFVFCTLACYFASQFQNARLPVMLACLVPFLAGVLGLWLVDSSVPYGRLACLWIAFAYTASWTLSMSVATANTAGHTKKVTTNALLLIGYCLGNFIGPFFFKSEQAPRYNLGTGMMLFCIGLQVVCICALWALLWSRNRRTGEPQTADERQTARRNGFLDVTDRNNPFFKYKY